MRPKITAMLIMVPERRPSLLETLEACGFDVLPVCDCSEARRILETEPKVQVVLTDSVLPDGDWRRVLETVAQAGANIEVVVSARLADHKLWIDVLEQGAYDVLVEPYQHDEVRRIVEAAADKRYMRTLPPAPAISCKPKTARAAGAADRYDPMPALAHAKDSIIRRKK
jgi:DNA-binding NtrC family response regulator